MTALAHLAPPAEALAALLARLEPVTGDEEVPLARATGRILGQDVRADRPSPPADVSAMDGFAVRHADLAMGELPVSGEAVMGGEIASLVAASALRIFTGAPVPRGADMVVRREDVEEGEGTIRISPAATGLAAGDHVRRAGENVAPGDLVVRAGRPITPAVAGALAAFGVVRPRVRRRVRVAILVTGDELVAAADVPGPTSLRDSNGPALAATLSVLPWIDVVSSTRAGDDAGTLREALARAREGADAVLLSGGVSMGDHDHVPDAVRALGGEVVFHKLAIRPGKPVLGAVDPDGRLLMGLPGNPVSVLVTARRLAVPALRRLGGERSDPARVELAADIGDAHALTRFPLVEPAGPGRVALVPGRGSGDLVAAARSIGFVEVPAGVTGAGPFDFYPWGGS